jgi:uncharacterized protein YciI
MTGKKLMKILLLALSVSLLAPLLTGEQQKSEPPLKLVQFQMALLRKGPKWSAEQTKETMQLHQEHVAYVTSLLESGKAMIAGPLSDETDLRGLYIFRSQSADDAKAWAENDPAVKAGRLVAEMHPWWAEDVMKRANTPLKLITVYLAFLKRGASWTAAETTENAELQKAHLANIRHLAEMKKLVTAGPFGDNGDLRGIFVFRVGSLEEAKALCATDPAVKAGHLSVELHSWQVPEGVFQ